MKRDLLYQLTQVGLGSLNNGCALQRLRTQQLPKAWRAPREPLVSSAPHGRLKEVMDGGSHSYRGRITGRRKDESRQRRTASHPGC